tara:strand:- start:3552 stop:3926 length:375 start_codon:yes stop_codon:yes gene_type:complete
MAVTSTKSGVSIKDDMVHDADVDATVEQNLFGGSGTLYSLTCYFVSDTSDDEVTCIKMADTLSATVGTTNPDIKFPIAEGTFFTMVCVDGFSVSDGLALWGTLSALVGSTDPPVGTVKAWAVFR